MASCYLIDNSATLVKGFHYCTTTLTGAECPPLAAISANNEVIVLPKHKNNASQRSNGAGRGGAASRIREECERLFCETMKTVFLGERTTATHASLLTGASDSHTSYQSYQGYQGSSGAQSYQSHQSHHSSGSGYSRNSLTPPSDEDEDDYLRRASVSSNFSAVSSAASFASSASSVNSLNPFDEKPFSYAAPTAWLELWDFAGGASFRGFLSEDVAGSELSLFAFFDAHMLVNNGDLKMSLMALIELADSALGCAHLVVCVDRRALPLLEDAASLMKGLQWAGFSLTTLDAWTGGEGVDVTSQNWVFMGMEL
ncbi:ornithine decarboxylase antizyme [Ophiostoma piceae UAMH 11346]|uniref:Ornithine decarboxylase antizyme n=1 Tax=Ophiostoma piceae (strain UAMH 11346) TaxID=1262450 RepID=S3C934_OPHP1|nr:ornithine decarboxylase antizyme [Ophiostoma piceae UAMH 11346]